MTKSSPLDPKAGAAAYAALASVIQAIPDDAVRSPRTDVQRAVVAALALVPLLRQPDVRAQFQRLPRDVFDISHLDGLETAAWSAWHCQSQSLSEDAVTSDALVPPAVAAEATALRARMMRLFEYWFEGDETVSAELASIRLGSGYRDLATDLTRLATLFDTHRSVIEADRKSYRKDDGKQARKAAEQIVESLVDSESNGKVWHDRRDRAYMHLTTVYKEITAAGAFLFRGRGEAERFAVSLAGAGRSKRRARPAPPAPVAAPPPPPPSGATNGAGAPPHRPEEKPKRQTAM